jgi:broad specificity phosphatase PhoE
MKLIITRHGETVGNVNNFCQGQTPGQLTKKGIDQAKKLGKRFKDEKIDVIVSSDLKRAIDTAGEIIKHHPNLKLKLDKRIRERSLGSMEGKPLPKNIDWNNLPKDVETTKDIIKRAKEFIYDIYKLYKNKTVLIVCHGGTKYALFSVLFNKSMEEVIEKIIGINKIKNASVSVFDIKEDKKHKMHYINCTKHLE